MALRKHNLARRVVGWGRHPQRLARAKRLGAVDQTTLDLSKAVGGAEIVVLATPVGEIPRLAGRVARMLPQNAIFTDVGSSKAWILKEVDRRGGRAGRFVGGHPFAGSERVGVESTRADLFKGSLFFLVPSRSAQLTAQAKVRRMWRGVGAKVVRLSAGEHDRLAAGISHLPHLAAAALVLSFSDRDAKSASTGFRDTTRIAQSGAAMWRDILISNRQEVLTAVKHYRRTLEGMERMLRRGDAKKLMKCLAVAARKRAAL